MLKLLMNLLYLKHFVVLNVDKLENLGHDQSNRDTSHNIEGKTGYTNQTLTLLQALLDNH